MTGDSSEEFLPFSALIPAISRRFGMRVHLSTLHRWRSRGVRGRKLRCVRLGGRWLSSLCAIDEFSSVPVIGGRAARAKAAMDSLKAEFPGLGETDGLKKHRGPKSSGANPL